MAHKRTHDDNIESDELERRVRFRTHIITQTPPQNTTTGGAAAAAVPVAPVARRPLAFATGGVAATAGRTHGSREHPLCVTDGAARFFPAAMKQNASGFLAGNFSAAIPVSEFFCSNNTDRPRLSFAALGVSPTIRVGDVDVPQMFAGITYLENVSGRNATNPTIVKTIKTHSTTLRIADTQSSITGTVTEHEMAPFTTARERAQQNPNFLSAIMQTIADECASRDTFIEMLKNAARREVSEETGLTFDTQDLVFVQFQRNWATFKINIDRMHPLNAVDCQALMQMMAATTDFRIVVPGRGGRGIPLKVQVYIYGAKETFYAKLGAVRVRPRVETETDLGGVMLYNVTDVDKFSV